MLVSLPIPCSSYVPEPKTFLHYISAEAKQLWTVGVLLVMARASPPVRLAIAVLLLAATVSALPPRLWRPQLARLGGLCAVLFFFTLIGAWNRATHVHEGRAFATGWVLGATHFLALQESVHVWCLALCIQWIAQ